MTARSSRPDPPTPRPLSNWSIVAGALVVLAVAAVVLFLLLRRYGGQGAQIQLDAIRTAGTLIIGTGGAVALLLTARRQRYTELTLVHTTRDATERRITELYTKAADQLGSEKAPVRLAGLHALERLAQNTPEQRQTIVDVICAYLRMPYTPPEDQPPAEDAPAEAHTRYENRREELQVRLTAQRILGAHLRSEAPDNFWAGIDLDLKEAQLHNFDLSGCRVLTALFDGARFYGATVFNGAQFSMGAWFYGAQFGVYAGFRGTQFGRYAGFGRAQFGEGRGSRWGADFGGAQFNCNVDFNGAQFGGSVDFDRAQLGGSAFFDGARARSHHRRSWPAGWTTRDARTAEGEEAGWMYLVRDEGGDEQQPDREDRNGSEAGTSGT